MIFVVKYASAMVFGGDVLGGTQRIWGNPYLNSTTVLFDKSAILQHVIEHSFRTFVMTVLQT